MGSRRALNPAFAAAHGLTKKDDNDDDGIIIVDSKARGSRQPSNNHNSKRLELILKEARATGKLQACNAGLHHPLPETIFDLRQGLVVDLSMDSSSSRQTQNDVFAFAEETLMTVDLSDNDLKGTELDQRVLRYEQVQVLRWKRCSLTAMNINLISLEQLTVLDLEGNQLQQFQLESLPHSLQELNLANNQLSELSSNDVSLEHLVSIDLSENQLEKLSLQVRWPRLRSFRCRQNKLKELTSLDSAKDSLQILDLTRNCLQGSPINLSTFTQLQTVLLAFNQLTTVPCIPSTVTRLDLTTNRIESVQGLWVENDAETPSLVELLLHDNYLTDLDGPVIAKCTNLRRLDVSSNKLKTLPYQLGFLEHIQNLTVTGNPLFNFKDAELSSYKVLQEKLRNRAPKESNGGPSPTRSHLLSTALRNKNSMDLSRQPNLDFQQLIAELQASPSIADDIVELTLDKNNLEEFPHEMLSLLPNLKELSLCGNAIKTLPPSVVSSSCPKLKKLRLAHNAITQINDLFLEEQNSLWAQNLTHLDLTGNRLTDINGEIWKRLGNLQVLSLSYNQIKSITDWTWFPPTLVRLDLSENQLEQVDGLIIDLCAYCPNLEMLWLQNNCIRCIPPTIGLLQDQCPNLKVLDLKGNPQHAIRPAILVKSTQEQLEYLRNRMTEDQVASAMAQIAVLVPRDENVPLPTGGANDLTPSVVTITPFDSNGPPQCHHQEQQPSSMTASKSVQEETVNENVETNVETMLASLRHKISALEVELDNPSLSQAKRYALKKSLAMERSKLIREERALGIRK